MTDGIRGAAAGELPPPPCYTTLPARYVVVVEEGGPGPALEWGLRWGRIRSVPVQLAGPAGTFSFASSYLQSIASQLQHARHRHPGVELSAAPGGTADLRPDDLLILGLHPTRDEATRAHAARLAGLAPCTTLLVPPMTASVGHGVLAAVGTLDRGRPVVRYAAAEAELRDEPLTLLHVTDTDSANESDLLAELEAVVTAEYPAVTCSTRRLHGDVVTEVAKAAQDAALLVVGAERVTSPATTLGRIVASTPIPTVVAKAAFEGPNALPDARLRY